MSSSTSCKIDNGIEGCNNETKSPDGICRICAYKIEKGLIEKKLKPVVLEKPVVKVKERSESMPIAEKICIGTEKKECGKPFAPTSNRQERCNDCREIHKKEYQASTRTKTKGPKGKKKVAKKKVVKKKTVKLKIPKANGTDALVKRLLDNYEVAQNTAEVAQKTVDENVDRAKCLHVSLVTIRDTAGVPIEIPELRVGQ